MKTTIQQSEDKYPITLEGEMDTAAAVEVEKQLQPLYNTNGQDVIIDCSKLEYIASSGLRILISILKGAKAGGSRVVLKDVNDDIKTVFKLTGFINIFDFE
jgi:anti-sigma B factor antagonist